MSPPRSGDRRAASTAAETISPEMTALKSKALLAVTLASSLRVQWPGSGGVCPAQRHHRGSAMMPPNMVTQIARVSSSLNLTASRLT